MDRSTQPRSVLVPPAGLVAGTPPLRLGRRSLRCSGARSRSRSARLFRNPARLVSLGRARRRASQRGRYGNAGADLPHRIRRMLSGAPVPSISRPRLAFTAVVCAAAAAILAAGTLVRAQSEPARFEAASIKRSTGRVADPGNSIELNLQRSIAYGSSGGRFNMQGVPLSLLIQLAYNVKDSQVLAAPSWAKSEGYEVIAKAEGNATFDQMRPIPAPMLPREPRLVSRQVGVQVLADAVK